MLLNTNTKTMGQLIAAAVKNGWLVVKSEGISTTRNNIVFILHWM